MKKDHWLYLLAVVGGAAIWIFVAAVSGKREAWDSGLYFSMGWPAACLISFVLGFIEPARPWRWGIAPFVGQLAWMVLAQGGGNLLPLGVVMFGVLSIPAIMTAKAGAFVAMKRQNHE